MKTEIMTFNQWIKLPSGEYETGIIVKTFKFKRKFAFSHSVQKIIYII